MSSCNWIETAGRVLQANDPAAGSPLRAAFGRQHPRGGGGAGLKLTCLIIHHSVTGPRLRLDRNLALPARVQVIDVVRRVALETEAVWRKGQEAGLEQTDESSLGGLIPSRLAAARDAFVKAGGR